MGREAKQQPGRKLVKITNTGIPFREKIKNDCFSFIKGYYVLTECLHFEAVGKILVGVPFIQKASEWQTVLADRMMPGCYYRAKDECYWSL